MATLIDYAFVALFWVMLARLGYLAWRSFRSKRVRRSAILSICIVAMLWGGLYVGLTPGARVYSMYRLSGELFGRGFLFTKAPRYLYTSPPNFLGDGYYIEVVETGEKLAGWMGKPPADLFVNYPIAPGYRSAWKSIPWHKTPTPATEQKILDLALSGYDNTADLRAAIALLQRLANAPDNYIAFRYKSSLSGDRVENVDLFLISPVERVLILVDCNT